ncbi:hypothetical protein [Halobacillus faecis]
MKVFVIGKFADDIVQAVLGVTDLKYGNYDGVYFSSYGAEWCVPREGSNTYAGNKDETYSTPSNELEFSIPRDDELLSKVVEAIYLYHPWDEPVISISESIDTRKNGVI